MRLTSFSDYALRLLIHAAAHADRLITIEEAALAYGISRSHLTKVANVLTRHGFLVAVRGRSGGLRMGREPATLMLGEVLRVTEPDFASIDCFGPDEVASGSLPGSPGRPPALAATISAALAAFLAVMDSRSLADLLPYPRAGSPPLPGSSAQSGSPPAGSVTHPATCPSSDALS